MDMHALVANLIQLGLLGLGVSLLLVCIHYLKPELDPHSHEERDRSEAQALAVSATRSRTGP
jgi:hypothetical protein